MYVAAIVSINRLLHMWLLQSPLCSRREIFSNCIFLWAIVRCFLKVSRKVSVRFDKKNRVSGSGGEIVLLKERFESFPKGSSTISRLCRLSFISSPTFSQLKGLIFFQVLCNFSCSLDNCILNSVSVVWERKSITVSPKIFFSLNYNGLIKYLLKVIWNRFEVLILWVHI